MTTTGNPLRLAVIVGSTRAGRFGSTVATWFVDHAARRADISIELLDLAQTQLPAHMSADPDPGDARARADVGARLGEADAFVVVTPEYNHSYPAPLKNAIDWHFTQWQAKPVGFVSYGGISGGLRAVEYLKQVFTELHAVPVRDTVSFHSATAQFDSDGRPTNPTESAAAATKLLDQLALFGLALRSARSERPYTA